jgi:hypothetical protein
VTSFFSTSLFEEVRPEFFRVLSGTAARLYADALDHLERASVEQAAQGLEREDALAIVEQIVEAHSEVGLEDGDNPFLGTREKARYALDVLFQAGWLEEEQRSDWRRLVHFNATGIALLRVLREIAFPGASIFSDKLVSVCTTLARRDPTNDPLMNEPWQHVESCIASLQAGINELRGMQKAIDRHTRKQLAAETLKENLAVLFDQFAERIGHACYSELVRARLPLRLAQARTRVGEMQFDALLLVKMQDEIMRREPALAAATAMSRAQVRLEELANLLGAVVPVAEAVDRRTAEFTRRSLARFRYLQETTTQNRLRVQALFETLNRLLGGRRFSNLNEEDLRFPNLMIVDARLLCGLESLYTPRLRRMASEILPMDQELTEGDQERTLEELKTSIRDSLTVARANRFVEELLPQPSSNILSKDIPIENNDALADLVACLLNTGTRDANYFIDRTRDLGTGDDGFDLKGTHLIERFLLSRK